MLRFLPYQTNLSFRESPVPSCSKPRLTFKGGLALIGFQITRPRGQKLLSHSMIFLIWVKIWCTILLFLLESVVSHTFWTCIMHAGFTGIINLFQLITVSVCMAGRRKEVKMKFYCSLLTWHCKQNDVSSVYSVCFKQFYR